MKRLQFPKLSVPSERQTFHTAQKTTVVGGTVSGWNWENWVVVFWNFVAFSVVGLLVLSGLAVCGRSLAEIVASNSTRRMFVCCECCVLSGRGLCDELITRREESYRLCWVFVCDLENS